MTVSQSVFAARYKLACFYIANHIYETVIANDPNIDLTDISKLQRDQGFFMSSLRLVEQLTAFVNESDLEKIKSRIEESGTMYFRKSILEATVKQGSEISAGKSQDPKKQEVVNVYDKFIVKKLYDSYFSSYVPDEPLEFLDQASQKDPSEVVSIFELGVFSSEVLQTISGILNFDSTCEALEVINELQNNERYSTYKHFFTLISKCL